MKRIFCIICVFALCLTMNACDPGTYRFGKDLNSEDIISVELICYENSRQKKFLSWVPDHSARMRDLDLSSVSVLETLPHERQDSFLKQLAQREILMGYDPFDSPKGICIRVTYNNGDFLIINTDYENHSYCGYIGMYDREGKLLDFIGSFVSYRSFESLVNDYFKTQV